MDYLVRFVQWHETFRRPEAESLAELQGLAIEWVSYSHNVGHHLAAGGGQEIGSIMRPNDHYRAPAG